MLIAKRYLTKSSCGLNFIRKVAWSCIFVGVLLLPLIYVTFISSQDHDRTIQRPIEQLKIPPRDILRDPPINQNGLRNQMRQVNSVRMEPGANVHSGNKAPKGARNIGVDKSSNQNSAQVAKQHMPTQNGNQKVTHERKPYACVNASIPEKRHLYNYMNCTEKVLILTPISDSEINLLHYRRILESLSYPSHLISVALGEDSSNDDTHKKGQELMNEFNRLGAFRRANFFHFPHNTFMRRRGEDRHNAHFQLRRRGHLARSRNSLLMWALEDEEWVMWMDSDISFAPKDIIQQLLSAEKDIVVPVCLYRQGQYVDIYDRNTWRETDLSLKYLAAMPKQFLMLEGYMPTKRKYLTHLRDEGRVVPIDGVGGCVLLVRAECHRQGLVFPPYVFDHHIETEGLGRVAKEMGYKIYGMPRVEVFH